MNKNKQYVVTTPIFYPNSEPHVGHALTMFLADAQRLHKEQQGNQNVVLTTGADEHGEKIQKAARAVGVNPQQFVDEKASVFVDTWKLLELDNFNFQRTTDEKHKLFIQDIWNKCVANGDIYLGTHKGDYCVGCECFYTAKECFVDGSGQKHCLTHKVPLKEVEEENYFFRLSKYTEKVATLIEQDIIKILPFERKNEILSFIKTNEPRDISISRTSFSWGIPVPGDNKHVVYVWFDALLNYYSFGNKSPDICVIGKDILKFHALYLPAILLSAGYEEDELPKVILTHGFITSSTGDKLGKSTGNASRLQDIVQDTSVDALRWYLLKNGGNCNDFEFSSTKLKETYQIDLVGKIGNLLNRSLPFVKKHFDGKFPEDPETLQKIELANNETYNPEDNVNGINAALYVANILNKLFDETKPWQLSKVIKDETKSTEERENAFVNLRTLLKKLKTGLLFISCLIYPVLPAKSLELKENVLNTATSSNVLFQPLNAR